MAEVKWIKLIVNTRNGKSMKQIKGLPDGFKVALFWYELMQLAGECNEKGFLYYEQDFPYTDDMLANEFGYDKEFIKYALKIFLQLKMVELKDDAYQLSNWNKYQNLEKLARIREDTRTRVANFRERKQIALEENETSEECNAICNANVTQCNGVDIDKDIDINININKGYKSIKQQIEDFTTNEELKTTLREFVLMREKIRKKLTDYAFYRLLNKLGKLSSKTEEQLEILNRSIENSWNDIYALNSKYKSFNNNNKKEKEVPSWYEDYKNKLDNLPKKEEMSQEEVDKILKEAERDFK